jgi:hypothetical protein
MQRPSIPVGFVPFDAPIRGGGSDGGKASPLLHFGDRHRPVRHRFGHFSGADTTLVVRTRKGKCIGATDPTPAWMIRPHRLGNDHVSVTPHGPEELNQTVVL